MTTSPERPRLAIRVGVTGHRAERLTRLAADAATDPVAHEAALTVVLASVLDAIEQGCVHLRSAPGGSFSDQPPMISLLVGAAFGVDRIAAALVSTRKPSHSGSPPGAAEAFVQWRLEAVLPAPLLLTAEAALADYEHSSRPDGGLPSQADYAAEWQAFLARCDSVTTLPATWRAGGEPAPQLDPMPPFEPADRIEGDYRISYVVAADFQLSQLDLLIAVWDGKPSRGPGGVADIVAHAHAVRLPVIVVDAARPERPPAMLQSITFGPERTNIVGWSPEPVEPVIEAADCRDDAIADAIGSLLDLHRGDESAAAHDAPALALETFLREASPRGRPSRVYEWFVRLLGGSGRSATGRGVPGSRAGSGWTGWAETVRGESGLSGDFVILQRRYAAASALANDYASRYRSTFVSAFALGALATGFAVVGQAFNVQRLAIKAAVICAELLLILWVVRIIRNGRRRHYHAKYVEYRTLAESLYGLRFLGAFGEALGASPRKVERWTDWYVRCTARELALPDLALDATFQRRVLKAVCAYEITPQIAYHEANAERMQRVEHRIHRIGNAMFVTVLLSLIVLCAFWAAESVFDHPPGPFVAGFLRPILNIVAAFFPTAGAALAGIRFMADFEGRAIRSQEAAADLRRLGERAEAAQHTQQFSATREILHDLATTLKRDVKLFHANFSRRQLSLPG